MTRAHFTAPYLLNPQHPVTVSVIGAGGTGSQVITCLGRMDQALRQLDHPRLFLTVYDPDEVTSANIGRQLFSEADLGLNKAQCLITRLNRFFGNDWRAVAGCFPKMPPVEGTNLYITCTDSVQSRVGLSKLLRSMPRNSYTDYTTPLYWMDFGNARSTGQVILGSVGRVVKQPSSKIYTPVSKLPPVTEYVKRYDKLRDDDSGPSCSLAQALGRQDLFINSTLAQLGCALLWKLFREGLILHHGLYLNLDTLRVTPIYV